MNILMLEWKSFGNEDMISAFREMGHQVTSIPFSNKELAHLRDPFLFSRLCIFL